MGMRPETGPDWGAPGYGPEKAFAASCGLCHTPTGYRSLAESFEGMDKDEIADFVDESGELLDEMPGFYGPETQKALLVDHLHALGEAAAAAAEEGDGS
jgi:mono/diheme cytochrome c family protein